MIRLSQIKIKIPHTEEDLLKEITKRAYGEKPVGWKIVRKSIDARKKPELYVIYTIDASFANEKKVLHRRNGKWEKINEKTYRFPHHNQRLLRKEDRPVVIGAGPAGLFAALLLARGGFSPVLYERGDAVDVRTEVVERFFDTGSLDEESNVQFGEGGAGTFSDGKLNTAVKDKTGKNRFVLQEFVRHGAPEDILYDAKPHIGTDILKNVVASIREEILSLGGEVHFRTKLTGLLIEEQAGRRLSGIRLENKSEGRTRIWEQACNAVILAIGHSARDTFFMLQEQNVKMLPKSFAIGVRVEHPAACINESQYGKEYAEMLPAASYKLTHQCKNGRGIYSFCMCPGGYVVNSSSEEGRICVNGMSYHGRDGRNSNSAIITTVSPEDFAAATGRKTDDPLAGIEFQRKYEALAFQAGQGKVPVQVYGDFRQGKKSSGFGAVEPSIKGRWQFADLRDCLPPYIVASILEGMEAFGRRIHRFDQEDAVFSGVETRTSSPVRIERKENGQSDIRGLFPCGEGAGYAGGITSAAMDGIRMAEAAADFLLSL